MLPLDLVTFNYHVVSDEDLAHVRLYRYKNSAEFEKDVAYVRDRTVSYADVVKHRLEHSPLPANSVLFTFDDGFAECYDVVRPILLRHRVPAAFFVTTDFLDERQPFYETKLSLCLTEIERMSNAQAAGIVEKLNRDPSFVRRRGVLAGGAAAARLRRARVSAPLHPEKRMLILCILGLQSDDEVGIERACELFRVDFAAYRANRRLFLSSSQVKQLAADGFTIGAHGTKHRLLVGESPESIARDVVTSAQAVRDLTGQANVPFAFPYEGRAIDRRILANIRARHPFIQLFFDSGALHRDAPFLVNRISADRPSNVSGSNLIETVKAASSRFSVFFRARFADSFETSPTTERNEPDPQSETRGLSRTARSTLFVMGASLGAALLGFLREVINAKYYGTQWQMDTFLAASVIPAVLSGVFNGALVGALVPTFSEYIGHQQSKEAWRLGSTIVNLLGLTMLGCAILGYVLAPWYVPLVAHGFPKPHIEVAIRMTRLLIPTVVALALAGVLSGILNAFHRFSAAAIIGTVLNLVTIATVVMLNHRFGIYALVYGTMLGFVAQLVVQIPSFLSLGGYRLLIDLHHPGLKKMLSLLGPISLGSVAEQSALFFNRFFASTLPAGHIAGMNYATKLANFPLQIFVVAIGTVIYPLLALHFARENREAVARSTIRGLRLVNFITIPSVCALIVLAHPIVQTLFQRGSFGVNSVNLTASLLPYAALALPAMAAGIVLTRCLFACRQIAWPVGVTVCTVALNVILSILWLPSLGARGLLLANAVSQAFQMIALLLLVARFVAHVDWGGLLVSTLKIGACALVMVAALAWLSSLGAPQPSLILRAGVLSIQVAAGMLVFLAVARAFALDELSIIYNAMLSRFKRSAVPAANS
jgi:putative peptidoglycan lipid II flippase